MLVRIPFVHFPPGKLESNHKIGPLDLITQFFCKSLHTWQEHIEEICKETHFQSFISINITMYKVKRTKIEDMYNSKKLPRAKTLHPMKPACCKEKNQVPTSPVNMSCSFLFHYVSKQD